MARRALLIVMVSAMLGVGCGTTSDGSTASTREELQLTALPTTDHLGGLARETMIVEGPDASLFVAGYGTDKPALWRSLDGGTTWESANVGSEADGAVGNSDVDLAVAEDGVIYFAVMSYDSQVSEGKGIAAATSPDGGSTWNWRWLSRDRFDDRPWIEVAPDGVAHAIWNDGSGVNHAVSSDRGLTWREGPKVHSSGGSSHFAISPTGTLAVRVTPLSASGNKFDPGVDGVAVSTDAGATWDFQHLPGAREWSRSFDPSQAVLRWVEPVAWDSGGALFTLWSEDTVLWLGRTRDNGRSWSRWPIVEATTRMYFPYLVARGKGELAATWFAGLGDSLRANLALIHIEDESQESPHVAYATPFVVPAYNPPVANAIPTRDTGGEYIPIIFLSDGRLAIVTTIQDPISDRWGFTFRPYRIESAEDVGS